MGTHGSQQRPTTLKESEYDVNFYQRLDGIFQLEPDDSYNFRLFLQTVSKLPRRTCPVLKAEHNSEAFTMALSVVLKFMELDVRLRNMQYQAFMNSWNEEDNGDPHEFYTEYGKYSST